MQTQVYLFWHCHHKIAWSNIMLLGNNAKIISMSIYAAKEKFKQASKTDPPTNNNSINRCLEFETMLSNLEASIN